MQEIHMKKWWETSQLHPFPMAWVLRPAMPMGWRPAIVLMALRPWILSTPCTGRVSCPGGCPFWRRRRLAATLMNVPGPDFMFTVMDFLLHFELVSLVIPFIFIPFHHSLNLHAPRLIRCDRHGFANGGFFQKGAKLVVASCSRRCRAGNELVWLSERGTRVLGVDEEFSGSMRDPFETSRRVHDF